MNCQYVCYSYNSELPRDAPHRARFSPIYCDNEATLSFDRGQFTPYPDCNGWITICEHHEEIERMQRALHEGLANGTITLD